jgi:serine/threonine-protein kinase RsbW
MIRKEGIELKTDRLYINKVEQFVEQICDEYNIFTDYYGNILMSVIEAYTNAVVHGNHYDENKHVQIRFESETNGLAFYVEDEGAGFDVNGVPDPTDINATGEEGRGLFTIKALADKVEFLNNGSTIKMTFLISSINHEVASKRAALYHDYVGQGVKNNAQIN